jgi:GAF domain-containing protein
VSEVTSLVWDETDPAASYALLGRQLAALAQGEEDALAAVANGLALLARTLPDVNWVGIYRARGRTLHLGPFQGAPACTRIAFGSGVCGDAAQQRRTILVADVDRYPGHIVCDPSARSEIVLPLVHADVLLGVLDLDAPRRARFGEVDRRGLEAAVDLWLESLAPLLARETARELFPALVT